MKYLPTIDLWQPGITDAIQCGQLRLQAGQWVKCGKGPCSRYSGVTGTGTIVATHPDYVNNRPVVSLARFRAHLDYYKGRV